MAINRIVILVLLVLSLVLLIFTYQSSQSLGDQVTEVITGRFIGYTIWFPILGAASAVTGVVLLLFSKSAPY